MVLWVFSGDLSWVHNMMIGFCFILFRKLPSISSISSICEHTPYNETIRNERNGRIDLDSIPTSTYGCIKGNSRDLTSQQSIKLGSQYDDRLPFHSFRIVPFSRLMFELFTNYHSLVPFPSLQFTLC